MQYPDIQWDAAYLSFSDSFLIYLPVVAALGSSFSMNSITVLTVSPADDDAAARVYEDAFH